MEGNDKVKVIALIVAHECVASSMRAQSRKVYV